MIDVDYAHTGYTRFDRSSIYHTLSLKAPSWQFIVALQTSGCGRQAGGAPFGSWFSKGYGL